MLLARNFNPEIHHRKSIRLKDFDYSQPGYYYITLCCFSREYLFGEIKEGKMVLNDFGKIAHDEWIISAQIRSEIELDTFVIMPNHFHAIVKIIPNNGRGDRPVAPTNETVAPRNETVAPTNETVAPRNESAAPMEMPRFHRGDQPVAPTGPKPESVGSLIAGYKSSVTKRINQLRKKPGDRVWQRNFYEHVIRDAISLIRIRQYIVDNPSNWINDEFYY